MPRLVHALVCLSAFLISSNRSFSASSPQIEYLNTLAGRGGPQGQAARTLAFDRQGNAFVGGVDAAFVTKLDPSGQEILYRTFLGSVGADSIDALAVTPDGSVYAAGANRVPGTKTSGFLAKLDPAGKEVWYRPLTAPVVAVALDLQGAVYYASTETVTKLDSFEVRAPAALTSLSVSLSGVTWAAGAGYLARLNPAGEGWDAILHLANTSVRALALDVAGTPYIAAVTGSKAFVARVQGDAGALAWRTNLGSSQIPNALALAPNANLFVAGDELTHAFLSQVDGTDRISETTELGDSVLERIAAVAINQKGQVWIAGSVGSGIPDALVAKLQPDPPLLSAAMTGTYMSGTASVAPFATALPSRLATGSVGTKLKTLIYGLYNPGGLALDASGNVYIADTGNRAIEKWTAATGQMTTLISGLNVPENLVLDKDGNIYFTDGSVKKWTAATSQLTTLVPGGPGSFFLGLAADGAGNLFFTDVYNLLLRKWTAATGQVTTLASTWTNSGPSYPEGIAVDSGGNVYIADYEKNAIRKWSASTGYVTTFIKGLDEPEAVALDRAGNLYIPEGNAIKKWTAATGQVTTLPWSQSAAGGIAVDGAGNLYISDSDNGVIRKRIAATGQETAIVSSALDTPGGLAVDAGGNLYIADSGHNAIQKWTEATGQLTPLVSGVLDVADVALDNTGNLYIGSPPDIYKWTAATGQLTMLLPYNNFGLGAAFVSPGITVDRAGNAYFSYYAGEVAEWNLATGQVTSVVFPGLTHPAGLAADGAGNLYIADSGDSAIKKWTAATGQLTTLVSGIFSLDVAVDGAGNLYFSDIHYQNVAIEELTAATGQLTTLVSGFDTLTGVAVDKAGANVYLVRGNSIEQWTR